MKHLAIVRRSALVIAALGLAFSGLAPLAEARHACYPGKCKGGDARVGSIGAPRRMFLGRTNFATVNGRNIGKGSDVKAKLRASRGRTEPHVTSRMFVGPDDPFTFYFRVTPTSSGRMRLKGCAAAKPKDINKSNNCGSTRVRVVRGS